MTELTMKVLDEMVKLTERSRHVPIIRIYLNPDDWREARKSMEIVAAPVTGRIVGDTAFGIPVQITEALERGTFVLEYSVFNDSHLVAYKVVDHEVST